MNEEQREKSRLRALKWRAENLEKSREASRRWREANPEKMRESVRRWREKNLEKVSAYKRLRGIPPEERPVRDEAAVDAWRAEFARRWGELADRLGPEGLLSRLAALMRKERRR